ncbi:MAG TPA: hypothetical protein ENK08_11880 [Chloroflexi bacterium]|nr:hypothetical protein [Chloroflexota bacterium]
MQRWIKRLQNRLPIRSQGGQAIIIVALAFITLLLFVGLTTDAALIYVSYNRLRRAVDAAAVSAVNQYREGRTVSDMYNAVLETLQIQLPGLENARLYWCDYERNLDDPTDLGPALTDMLGQTFYPHIPRDDSVHQQNDPVGGETLCASPTDPPRKHVRVMAWLPVNLVFLRLVGRDQITLWAQSEAEAAVLQMVLLIDTSESMAYGVDEDGDGIVTESEDPNACPPYASAYPRTAHGTEFNTFYECIKACSTEGWCSPFEQVRSAAWEFAARMRDGVDWVGVYHLDKTPVMTQSVDVAVCTVTSGTQVLTKTVYMTITPSSGVVIPLTTTRQAVLDAIANNDLLHVYVKPAKWEFDPECDYTPTNPWSDNYYKWTSTNIGGGLREAVSELVNNGNREIGVWVIVLLSDGAANATDIAADENSWYTCPSGPPPGSGYLCPVAGSDARDERNYSPRCRDPELPDGTTDVLTTTVSRHCPSDEDCDRPWYTNLNDVYLPNCYDADDYARDAADLAASEQISVFTIGFGRLVVSARRGRADAGERLLRYIADVADDGNNETAPCGSDFYWSEEPDPMPPPGTDCGNYYYAPDPDHLEEVFEAIASRIFSRISR